MWQFTSGNIVCMKSKSGLSRYFRKCVTQRSLGCKKKSTALCITDYIYTLYHEFHRHNFLFSTDFTCTVLTYQTCKCTLANESHDFRWQLYASYLKGLQWKLLGSNWPQFSHPHGKPRCWQNTSLPDTSEVISIYMFEFDENMMELYMIRYSSWQIWQQPQIHEHIQLVKGH